jgi:hypothetical protein
LNLKNHRISNRYKRSIPQPAKTTFIKASYWEKAASFGSAFAFLKQKQVQKAEPNAP